MRRRGTVRLLPRLLQPLQHRRRHRHRVHLLPPLPLLSLSHERQSQPFHPLPLSLPLLLDQLLLLCRRLPRSRMKRMRISLHPSAFRYTLQVRSIYWVFQGICGREGAGGSRQGLEHLVSSFRRA